MAEDNQAVLKGDANANEDITNIRFCTQLIAPEFDLAQPLPQGNFVPHLPGDDPPLERLVSISFFTRYSVRASSDSISITGS